MLIEREAAATCCVICWSPDCRVFADGGDLYAHRHDVTRAKLARHKGLRTWQRHEADQAERQHQRETARAFGAARGWMLSEHSFLPSTLARRGCHDGAWGWRETSPPGYVWDHPYFYKSRRRAAGVACHLYDSVETARGWAAANGLIATLPPDPSWWNYPATTLVLYTPNDETNVVPLARWRR